MKPLHQILPNLEDAVAKRVADPHVQQLDVGELRSLVYRIVDGYRKRFDDPESWFDAMVLAANDRAEAVRGEQQSGASLRAQVLSRILTIAARAMPAIGTSVRTQVVRSGADQQYVVHPLLRGIELGGNRKQLQQNDGLRAIAGRTWWAVTLGGAASVHDARWAIMDHTGSIDTNGFGEERITISLSEPAELAHQVNDKIVGTMLLSLSTQLRRVDDNRAAAETERVRLRLDAALRALTDDDSRAR